MHYPTMRSKLGIVAEATELEKYTYYLSNPNPVRATVFHGQHRRDFAPSSDR